MMARKSFLKREKVERSKNKLIEYIKDCTEKKFIRDNVASFYFVATTPEEVIDLLDGKLDGKTV